MFKPSKHPQILPIPAWTCTLTKIVSNFSPTRFCESQRSMLKARRILTSTAALKRRLAGDEGRRIPPLTVSSYKTEAKDGSFSSSKFPPCGVRLALTVEYHRYETSTRHKAYSVLKTARCLFFFPSGKKENRHPMNISAFDLRGRHRRHDWVLLWNAIVFFNKNK